MSFMMRINESSLIRASDFIERLRSRSGFRQLRLHYFASQPCPIHTAAVVAAIPHLRETIFTRQPRCLGHNSLYEFSQHLPLRPPPTQNVVFLRAELLSALENDEVMGGSGSPFDARAKTKLERTFAPPPPHAKHSDGIIKIVFHPRKASLRSSLLSILFLCLILPTSGTLSTLTTREQAEFFCGVFLLYQRSTK